MLKKKFFNIGIFQVGGPDFVLFNITGAVTKKYTISTNVVTNGTNLSQPSSAGSAAGNLTLGLFLATNGGQLTSKYTFTTDGVVPGTSMGVNISNSGSATAGNGDLCITSRGGNTSSTLKYTYAGDGVSAGTALSAALLQGASTGNIDYAFFQLPTGAAGTNRYEYAGDVRIAGPNLTSGGATSSTGSSSGNGTIGLIGKSSSAVTDKLSFSANTCVAGGSLTASRNARGMAGDTVVGIFDMGSTTVNACIYTYAGDTTAAGASLQVASATGAAVCSVPAGVNV